ncbi:hypothetical protein HNQ80_004239 [Anaerosolibacter carboniphilus]|uniref:Uncharacterized protein n=1 Tax=Anaerosolibacter carboniphilus TaxID=1417629 RepID=A0A841L6T3_9FIRM|nr:hypothetical protein [Anaerosolibacter carboniphilus]MBB6218099.1 hypothetical protein [Anaerosolibacter carboniphilus]
MDSDASTKTSTKDELTADAQERIVELIKEKTNPNAMEKKLKDENLCSLVGRTLQSRIRQIFKKEWINPKFGWVDIDLVEHLEHYLQSSEKAPKHSIHPVEYEGVQLNNTTSSHQDEGTSELGYIDQSVLSENNSDSDSDPIDTYISGSEDLANMLDDNSILKVNENVSPPDKDKIYTLLSQMRDSFVAIEKSISFLHSDTQNIKQLITSTSNNQFSKLDSTRSTSFITNDSPDNSQSTVSINIEIKNPKST